MPREGTRGQLPAEAAKAQDARNATALASAPRLLWEWICAATAGVSALGLLRVLAPFLGFTIKVNGANLAFSALLGAPGVILLLLLRVCFVG